MSDETDEKQIGAGYPFGQFLKALAGDSPNSSKKIEQWKNVLIGMMNGSLKVGSRTPAGAPIWVTLEVAHGGFATGKFAASGALQTHEVEKFSALSRQLEDVEMPANQKRLSHHSPAVRNALNVYFSSTQSGYEELCQLLRNGSYRINVPEEGALLIVAWLLQKGETDAARKLIEIISPFFQQLRFYPVPASKPLQMSAGISVSSVSETITRLREKRRHRQVEQMNEAILVWLPLYDQAVALFLDTVEGDVPHLVVDDKNELIRTANGQPIVEGGWPCRKYSADWAARAASLLKDYNDARSLHSCCKKHLKTKENFARLMLYLKSAAKNTKNLSNGDAGAIRKILASFVTKHGAPGSERLTATRAEQTRVASLPTHRQLASLVADRLAPFKQDEGIPDMKQLLGPLTSVELADLGRTEELPIPRSILHKSLRCLEAPLKVLVEEGLVPSGETMARLVPRLTARILVSTIQDASLARVFEGCYRAFRARRSLLLLNLQSQAKFDELPWISSLQTWRNSSVDHLINAPMAALTEAAIIALEAFPQTILPNRLVKEFRILANSANLSIPLVEELAADIFMGQFAANYVHAAEDAANLLQGSLYERYYGIDYLEVLYIDDVAVGKFGVKTSTKFAEICYRRANLRSDKFSVATNGAVIEQCQILTTHNLASLFVNLSLTDKTQDILPQAARKCFKWICRRLQERYPIWRSELRSIKNTAYAWRQMIFYLSMMHSNEVTGFMDWACDYIAKQPLEFRQRFGSTWLGLQTVIAGGAFDENGNHPDGGRRLVGWIAGGRHWLRVDKPTASK